MTRATFPRAGTHPKHLRRRLTTPSPRIGRVPRGYPANWLVAELPWPGWSPPPTLVGLQICWRRATASLSKAIYVSEQVCIRWRSTDAYYTAKLTFSHDFPIKVWGAYCTSVRIILEFLRYCTVYTNVKTNEDKDKVACLIFRWWHCCYY